MSWKYVQYENGKYRTVENGGGGDVTSVNGQTGDVELDADDVGALPADTAIPSALSELTEDSTHRVVTDMEKSTWNGKSDFSGSYNDLTDKPTIPAAQVNSDWDAVSGVAQILNKPTIPVVTGKADKVSGATNGNIAGLDGNGNLTDSGIDGDMTTTSVTGNPLSLTTDSEQAARSCVITFEPIQAGSGDPSPENVRAISGYSKNELKVTGKNLFSGFTIGKGINSTTGAITNSSASATTEFIPVNFIDDSSRYTVSGLANTLRSFVAAYDNNKQFLGRMSGDSRTNAILSKDSFAYGTPQATGNIAYIMITQYEYSGGQGVINDVSSLSVQLELGSTATAYEPYSSIIDFSQPFPEPVYGCTLDVESGVLTVTRKRIDMGDLTWNYGSGSQVFNVSIPDKKDGDAHFVCEIYKDGGTAGYAVGNKEIAWNNGVNYRKFAFVKDTDYSTKETFTAAVTGKYLVYDLAEPYTIQLTPAQVRLLQGANVVTSNGTSIALTYRNGEVASLADVSSVAESVNALGEYVAANKAGDAVDLTSYNAGTNRFSFPCDGYVYINGRNNTSGYIRVYIYPKGGGTVIAPMSINITAVQQMQSVFVRKGMLCYVNTNIADVSTIIAQFRPLI